MRVAALQLDIVWERREENYQRVTEYARQAARQGADLLVLPEMFATGFSLQPSLTAETQEGPTASFIRELAAKLNLGVIGGLVLETKSGRGRNCALAVDRKGNDLALYTKTHLFSFMSEDEHHEAGALPEPFIFEETPCACFICYDLRFPELFRRVADHCHAVFVIASWPAARQQHWDILLPARAVENQGYVVGVNRVGQGGGLTFTGGSTIIDPLGNPVAHAGDSETLIVGDIDTAQVIGVRKSMPFLADRRF